MKLPKKALERAYLENFADFKPPKGIAYYVDVLGFHFNNQTNMDYFQSKNLFIYRNKIKFCFRMSSSEFEGKILSEKFFGRLGLQVF